MRALAKQPLFQLFINSPSRCSYRKIWMLAYDCLDVGG